MSRWLKLRAFEWVLLGFFYYAALIAPFFRREAGLAPHTLFLAACVTALFCLLSRFGQSRWRSPIAVAQEWMAVLLTYVAFREMGWFATPVYNVRLESQWIRWDVCLLGDWHGARIIDALGAVVPTYLELCYLLVYGLAAYGLALIYVTRVGERRRQDASAFLCLYLTGTLLAYGLFPFFPMEPPRFAYPNLFPPTENVFHVLNVRLLQAGTIRCGVFPSAHVSSVMSAAWALFWLFPERKRYGWIAFFYAVSVAVATVYCRYHYVADVVAGILVSLVPAGLALSRPREAQALRRS